MNFVISFPLFFSLSVVYSEHVSFIYWDDRCTCKGISLMLLGIDVTKLSYFKQGRPSYITEMAMKTF